MHKQNNSQTTGIISHVLFNDGLMKQINLKTEFIHLIANLSVLVCFYLVSNNWDQRNYKSNRIRKASETQSQECENYK